MLEHVQGSISAGFMLFVFFLRYLLLSGGRARRRAEQISGLTHAGCLCGFKNEEKGFAKSLWVCS